MHLVMISGIFYANLNLCCILYCMGVNILFFNSMCVSCRLLKDQEGLSNQYVAGSRQKKVGLEAT